MWGIYLPRPDRATGGLNPYQYAPNSIGWMDPLGLTADSGIITFYHAGDIIGNIDPSMGRVNLDFNPAGKGGFYVTTDKAQALDWANRRGHPSITRFDVPKSELAKLNIKSFSSANSEWANFVTQGRKGKLSHNYDAVSGPMLMNLNAFKKGASPIGKGSQMAIFSKKAAAIFNKFKKGCANQND